MKNYFGTLLVIWVCLGPVGCSSYMAPPTTRYPAQQLATNPTPPVVLDADFEQPFLGTPVDQTNFQYAPAGTAWTFSTTGTNVGAGLAGNNSLFTYQNSNAPSGLQVAFLQSTGSISQSVSFPAGTFQISFYAAQRGIYNQHNQSFQVSQGSEAIGTFTPPDTTYRSFSTSPFTLAQAATVTLSFEGQSTSGDTVFIDNIVITVPSSATPTPTPTATPAATVTALPPTSSPIANPSPTPTPTATAIPPTSSPIANPSPTTTTAPSPTATPTAPTPTPTSSPSGSLPPMIPAPTSVPPLGANVPVNSDASSNLPFNDMILSARGFYPFGDSSGSYTNFVASDWAGWPTADFTVLIATPYADSSGYLSGTYTLVFTGQATVTSNFSEVVVGTPSYDPNTNTTTASVQYNVNPTNFFNTLSLNFQNTSTVHPANPNVPNSTATPGAGLVNIHLYQPNSDPTQIFSANFLAAMAPFKILRFMDWGQTNGSPVTDWDPATAVQTGGVARNQPTSPIQTGPRGVAIEYMIALCNKLNADMWINIPEGASADYITKLAKTLLNGSSTPGIDPRLAAPLAPQLHVYVEWSNEVWNTGAAFTQTPTNHNQAVAEVASGFRYVPVSAKITGTPTGNSDLNFDNCSANLCAGANTGDWNFGYRRTGRQAFVVADIFASVWGMGAMNQRVRPVMAGLFADPGGPTYEEIVELTYMTSLVGKKPSDYIFALSGAPYFKATGSPVTAQGVLDSFASSLGDPAGGGAAGLGIFSVMAQNVTLAKSMGVHYMAYEAGPDDSQCGSSSTEKYNASLLFKDPGSTVNYSPSMQDLSQYLLNTFFAMGGDSMNWFTGGAGDFTLNTGTWPLTNVLSNTNTPKLLALNNFLADFNASNVTYTVGLPTSTSIQATDTTFPPGAPNGGMGVGVNFNYKYLMNIPAAGYYDVVVNYFSYGVNQQMQWLANGAQPTNLSLVECAGVACANHTYTNSPPFTLYLQKGLNVVEFTATVGNSYVISGFNVSPHP